MTAASATGSSTASTGLRPPGRRPRRWLRWLTGITVGFLLLLILAVLTRNLWLRSVVQQQIESSTGLRAEIGALFTPLGTGRFEVRDLKLFNTGQFGDSLMAHVPEFIVDLDPEQAANGQLRFHVLSLNVASMNVVRSTAGRLNVEGVQKKLRERIRRKRKKDRSFEFEFGGIDRLQLTLGTVQYTDLKRPAQSRALDLAVKDEVITQLNTDEDLQRWMGGFLFRILMQISLSDLSVPGNSTSATTTNSPALERRTNEAQLPPPSPQSISPR